MDNLMALDTKSSSLDDTRDYIKALATLGLRRTLPK
jgi:hypothetical protein